VVTENPEQLSNIPEDDHAHQDILRRYRILEVSLLAIAAANVGTWFLDEQTRLFIPSPRLKQLYGFHEDEKMSYEESIERIDPKYRNKFVESVELAIANREQFHMDYPVMGPHDTKPRWLKAMGGTYTDPEGHYYHFSGVVMDITEQKQTELRKNKFIGMVSHELKTPLTSLKAYVQMLYGWAKKQKDGFAEVALTKVERQVKKMQNMINGFLNVSQAETGKIHLNMQDFDFAELVKEVVEETRLITTGHTITIIPCESVMVHADREKIEQVIINLLNNAIKYSPKGTTIEVICETIDNMARVSVKDEGMGIEQKDIEKLFTRYYRVENKQTERIAGFGIGLYLSAEIIKHHQGTIKVESTVGAGSVFYFDLPLSPPTIIGV
jgi:two-component system sensor histidine kinase VicK